MKRSIWITCGCVTLATIGLAAEFAAEGMLEVTPAFFIIGILWLVAVIRRYRGISSLSFVVFIFSTAYSAWKGTPPILALLVVIATLSAWDFDAMLTRFLQVKTSADYQGIERQHLVRLLIIDGAALIVGGAALVIKLQIGFVVILALSFFVVWGLSQLVLNLRRTSE